jgi:hypothetical protein
MAFALGPDQVLGVGHAHDVVDVAAVTGRRESPASMATPRASDRLVAVRGSHVGTGHHDLAHDGVAELDDRVDELAFVTLDHVLLEGHVGHGQQLGLAHPEPAGPGGRGAGWPGR